MYITTLKQKSLLNSNDPFIQARYYLLKITIRCRSTNGTNRRFTFQQFVFGQCYDLVAYLPITYLRGRSWHSTMACSSCVKVHRLSLHVAFLLSIMPEVLRLKCCQNQKLTARIYHFMIISPSFAKITSILLLFNRNTQRQSRL